MTSPSRTITAELRKWRRRPEEGTLIVEGYIYNDINDVWEDGDLALIYPVIDWVESVNFYLAVTNTACYKCPKDEEMLNGRGDVGPASD